MVKKFAFFVLCLFGLTYISAQQMNGDEIDESVHSKVPSRMTFYGEFYARGWVGNISGKNYVQGADLKKDDTYFGLQWEFTNNTGLVCEIALNEQNKGGIFNFRNNIVGFKSAYAYSNIAGEFGAKTFMTKLSVGKFKFESAFLSSVDPMGTGGNIRHNGSIDPLNVQLEIGTKPDSAFPIELVLACDLDFGYLARKRPTDMEDSNNDGFSAMAEVKSVGLNIGETMNLSWNVYATHEFNANKSNPDRVGRDGVVHKLNTIGATADYKIGIMPDHTLAIGAGFEYDYYIMLGGDMQTWGPKVGSIDWQAGVSYTVNNLMAIALAMRQDNFNHMEKEWNSAIAKNYKEFNLGASVKFLGLKEIAKMSIYAGFGYGFGSYFDYAGRTVNPLSVDVGIGYHPTENANFYFGYQKGRYGVEAPTNSKGENGYSSQMGDWNWGQVYLKAGYKW